MQRISVNLKLLKEKIMEIEKDGMGLIELHIVASQIDDKLIHPTFLHLEGISDTGEYKDYESIDECPAKQYLLKNMPA
ncbi:hypothetical protein [Clostridium sp. KNHs216]|jgi:hypothetical protein|uniref:hypothetical protein n=1 Tax=Eubacteriales TaxID=186802 RepID=UPI00056E4955|nr:hypothetical protein [Clostridium sp. KNHs216]MBE6830190.1 hypothetical protein [Oscillospiraceae bacterium]TQI65378.1 hypothetical protein LY85_0008 [Clostridium sp. KNHs216]